MKKNIEVSLIIPVYNAEKWLKKCLDSIINQTYKNYEVIIIDDGSTDKSAEICDYYAINDNRISAYHICNGGVSNARNIGLSKAKGKYIVFVDSDDWMEPKYIEEMVCTINEKGVDLVKFNYFRNKNEKDSIVDNNYEKYKNQILTEKEINEDFISNILLNKIQAYLWTIIVKRDYATKIKFDKSLGLMEDTLYLVELLVNINNMYIDNRAFYHYRFVGNSASNNPDKIIRNINNIILINEKYNKLIKKYPKLMIHEKKYNATHITIIEYYIELLFNNNKIAEFKKYIKKIYNEKKVQKIFNKSDTRIIKKHKRVLISWIINDRIIFLNIYYKTKQFLKRIMKKK